MHCIPYFMKRYGIFLWNMVPVHNTSFMCDLPKYIHWQSWIRSEVMFTYDIWLNGFSFFKYLITAFRIFHEKKEKVKKYIYIIILLTSNTLKATAFFDRSSGISLVLATWSNFQIWMNIKKCLYTTKKEKFS